MATKSKAASASKQMLKGGSKTSAKQDVLVETAQEVENLTQPKAFALVDELIASGGVSDFRLGGVLAAIKDKADGEGGEAWLDGHDNFKDLVETRFAILSRKADYLISIYKNLVEKQIPWASVKDVGWTKLVVISGVITAKNVDTWVTRAAKMNVPTLQDAVKKAKEKGTTSKDSEIDTTPAVKQKVFKLYKDQVKNVDNALEKAKEEGKTEHDNVALDYICTAYLGNAVPDKAEEAEVEAPAKGALPKTKKAKITLLRALMKDLGAEEALGAFGEEFGDTWKVEAEPLETA